MKYSTAGAFRQALEERLRQQALETGVPMFRLRKGELPGNWRLVGRRWKKRPTPPRDSSTRFCKRRRLLQAGIPTGGSGPDEGPSWAVRLAVGSLVPW